MAEEQIQSGEEQGKSPVDKRMVQVARLLMHTRDQIEKLNQVATEITARQGDAAGSDDSSAGGGPIVAESPSLVIKTNVSAPENALRIAFVDS